MYRSNYKIIDAVISLLFSKEEEQFERRQVDLINLHIQRGGSPDGFRHMGVIYSQLIGRSRKMAKYDRVHPSLVPEIGAIDTDRKILEADKGLIKQILALLLQNCTSLQDIRDALPNGLVELLDDLRGYERTRPEAYTLEGDKAKLAQYKKFRDRIDFYIATRLIY